MSDVRSVVVLSVDWLRAAYLGCYGNTWIATPAINRLATESVVFDEAHAAGTELTDFFAAAWGDADRDPWIRLAEAQGRRTVFVTDDRNAARLAGAAGFDEVMELPAANAQRAADELEDTHAAGVVAAAMEQIDVFRREPFLLWLHLGTLGQAWDAPREFRERCHEEDDAPLPDLVEPPRKLLDADFDPDERWNYALAYAAQVSTLDACLDTLFEQLRETGLLGRAALMLCGVRGFPLGEHRRVGSIDGCLYGESLHVPWIVRWPDQSRAAERSSQLVTPHDLGRCAATFLNCGDLPNATRDACNRERILFRNAAGEFAIRTRDWFLRRSPAVDAHSGARVELYAKPDDRWEVNDVHDRCQEVVEELSGSLPDLKHGEPSAAVRPEPKAM